MRHNHYVYKLIKDNQIVYIGCSVNVDQRVIAHKYTKPYDKIERLGPFEKSYAFKLETELIKKYNPTYNLGLNGKARKTRVNPAEKVILVGFYVKKNFVDKVGGMDKAREIARETIETYDNY